MREVGAQDGRDDDSDDDWGDWSLAGNYIVGRGGKVQFALVWPGADLFSGLLTVEGDTVLPGNNWSVQLFTTRKVVIQDKVVCGVVLKTGKLFRLCPETGSWNDLGQGEACVRKGRLQFRAKWNSYSKELSCSSRMLSKTLRCDD